MDGPIVNWKSLDILEVDGKETNSEDLDLLCIGSSGIHRTYEKSGIHICSGIRMEHIKPDKVLLTGN